MIRAQTVKNQINAAKRVLAWYNKEQVDKQWLIEEWRMFNALSRYTAALEEAYKMEKEANDSKPS